MTDRTGIGTLRRSGRFNATLVWVLVGLVMLAAAESLVDDDPLWAGFAGLVAIVAVLPAAIERRPTAALPAEVIAVAAVPVIGGSVATVPLTGTMATYLSVAALALLVAVEFDTYTAVQMSPGFAIGFVIITTLAVAGGWAIVRWVVDGAFGTGFVNHETLMWEFVGAAFAGVVAGFGFEYYVRRRGFRSAVGIEGAG